MAQTPLPTGTVTFLFTDIEGSTRAWERDAAAMRTSLLHHDAILRRSVEVLGGRVFKTVGDAFCAVFSSAPAALGAAIAAQGELRTAFPEEAGPGRVRMAIHSGQADLRDDDYFGRTVNRVARLLAIGHGRQVLLSGSTRELVYDALPAGATLRDLGKHRLKDLERPEHVFQLQHPDLPGSFPPLRSLDARPNNLPIRLTSFIGRRSEITRVEALLATHRLVTLTGAAGSGKTRLALQVGAESLEDFVDGVWFVDLSSSADPALVPRTAALALGVREIPGREIEEVLADHLIEKKLLVILDNCEHLIEASAEWVESTLQGTLGVNVLATSREALGCAGEVVWAVPSLAVPAESDLAGSERLEIERYESMELFRERARLVEPGFEVTADDARAVARICRRLDGIPLAIELAAARVRVLAPEQIAARLDDRFRLLAGGRRALARHQTLQAAIDWSHDLLEERERILLRRASVFSGGWSLEAAESVCADAAGSARSEVGLDPEEILNLLSRLVEKSLVNADRTRREGVRYRMLESTRQYALDRLLEAGESETIRGRHAAWCLEIVERVRKERARGDPPDFGLIDLEYDNMRAALDWSLATPGEARIGYRIAAGLTSHWRRSSLLREGIDWLERALAAIADRDDSEKGLGLAGLSSLWYFRGDLKKAREASDRALASLDDTTDDASRLNVIASACRLDLQSADETERNRGFRLTEQGIALARKLGNRQAEAALSVNLGETLRERGDLAGARQRYEDALSLVQGESVLAMVFNLGQVAVELGDAGRAEEWYRKSHEISRTGDRNIEAYEILGMGQVAAVRSQHVRAVRLLGAAAAAFDKSGERLNTVDQGVLDRTVSACRKALGDEAYDDAWNAGRALEQERALDEAFSAWA